MAKRKRDAERLVDLRPSCTKEEAVAKLLGWRRGPLLRKFIFVGRRGIPADQLPDVPSTEMSLTERLGQLRDDARRKLARARKQKASPEALAEKESDLGAVDELLRKAQIYSADIEDEIAKGSASALRVDQAATADTGATHFLLASLDRWARDKYGGLSIFEGADAAPANPAAVASGKSPESEPSDREGWGYTKAKNFALTFLLALEAFAQKSGPMYGERGNLNAKALADELARRAEEANKGAEPQGQGAEAIRKRIAEALRLKRS